MRMRLLGLTLALLWTATVAAASSSDEARGWIKRMNDALINRNYDGVLTHRWQGGSEGLRLIHRMRDGRMVERVISLNGSGYEIVRNGTQHVEYFPAKRLALVQTLGRSFGYIAALNGVSVESEKYYVISNGGEQRLLGWGNPVQMISVEPRDALRYGYRFWLDKQTGMPVRTQLVNKAGDVIDEIAFSDLSLLETIPDEMLKPSVNAKDFRWMRRDMPKEVVTQAFVPRANKLPAGFRVLNFDSAAEGLVNSQAKGPKTRFVVSDGISWVSVVVTVAESVQVDGFTEGFGPPMGASASYVIRRENHYISVMGEVPPMVVKSIAQAVLPE